MSKRRGGFRLKGIPVRFKTRKARDRFRRQQGRKRRR
jgi:hypothetical protein